MKGSAGLDGKLYRVPWATTGLAGVDERREVSSAPVRPAATAVHAAASFELVLDPLLSEASQLCPPGQLLFAVTNGGTGLTFNLIVLGHVTDKFGANRVKCIRRSFG